VNESLAIRFEVAKASFCSKTSYNVNTPAGKISPINSISIITLVGVCSAGLTTAYNLSLSKLALLETKE
jgi:hypothetical protein